MIIIKNNNNKKTIINNKNVVNIRFLFKFLQNEVFLILPLI